MPRPQVHTRYTCLLHDATVLVVTGVVQQARGRGECAGRLIQRQNRGF